MATLHDYMREERLRGWSFRPVLDHDRWGLLWPEGQVQVAVIHLGIPKLKQGWRVAVWNADDIGMEKDFTEHDDARNHDDARRCLLSLPLVLCVDDLLSRGFVNA